MLSSRGRRGQHRKNCLLAFIENCLNNPTLNHLIRWVDQPDGLFQVLWVHGGRSNYHRGTHGCLFDLYRQYRGRGVTSDPKQAFRMALKKSPCVQALDGLASEDWRSFKIIRKCHGELLNPRSMQNSAKFLLPMVSRNMIKTSSKITNFPINSIPLNDQVFSDVDKVNTFGMTSREEKNQLNDTSLSCFLDKLAEDFVSHLDVGEVNCNFRGTADEAAARVTAAADIKGEMDLDQMMLRSIFQNDDKFVIDDANSVEDNCMEKNSCIDKSNCIKNKNCIENNNCINIDSNCGTDYVNCRGNVSDCMEDVTKFIANNALCSKHVINKYIENNTNCIVNNTDCMEGNVNCMKHNVNYMENNTCCMEGNYQCMENDAHGMEDTLHCVEDTLHCVEDTLHCVENNNYSVEDDILCMESNIPCIEDYTSLMRENTHCTKGFINLMEDSTHRLESNMQCREDIPHQREDIPHQREDIPHQREDIPHQREDIPHQREDILHQREDIPHQREDIPHQREDIPHQREDIPHQNEDNVNSMEENNIKSRNNLKPCCNGRKYVGRRGMEDNKTYLRGNIGWLQTNYQYSKSNKRYLGYNVNYMKNKNRCLEFVNSSETYWPNYQNVYARKEKNRQWQNNHNKRESGPINNHNRRECDPINNHNKRDSDSIFLSSMEHQFQEQLCMNDSNNLDLGPLP